MVKRLLNLAVAALFALPLASLAATSTYSTYSDSTATPSAGGYNGANQSFTLRNALMFCSEGEDVAATSSSLRLESIKFYWGTGTDSNAALGNNGALPDPDAWIVLTTTSDQIVGFSDVYNPKWVSGGSSTFVFSETILPVDTTYRAYFCTNISDLAVGGKFTSAKLAKARCAAVWHGSEHTTSGAVGAGGNSALSLKADFVVSKVWIDETETTTGTTGAWDTAPVWSDGKMAINGDNAFTPTTESPSNSTVTVTMTMCFEDVRDDVIEDPEATEGVQAAVCLAFLYQNSIISSQIVRVNKEQSKVI